MFLLDVKFYARDKERLFITNNTATNIENNFLFNVST